MALTIWTFVGKVMSLLFNMLGMSRFVLLGKRSITCKDTGSLEEKLEETSLNSILKSRDITLPIKVR